MHFIVKNGYTLSDIKQMTVRQFRKTLATIDKHARIVNDDMYEDEVTAESHRKTWLGIFGAK